MTPAEEHFNREKGLEILGCWTTLIFSEETGREGQSSPTFDLC